MRLSRAPGAVPVWIYEPNSNKNTTNVDPYLDRMLYLGSGPPPLGSLPGWRLLCPGLFLPARSTQRSESFLMQDDQTYPWKRKAVFRHVSRKWAGPPSRRAPDPHLSVHACPGDSRVWDESLWNFPFLHQNEVRLKLTTTSGII